VFILLWVTSWFEFWKWIYSLRITVKIKSIVFLKMYFLQRTFPFSSNLINPCPLRDTKSVICVLCNRHGFSKCTQWLQSVSFVSVTVMWLSTPFFWDVTHHHCVIGSWRFEGTVRPWERRYCVSSKRWYSIPQRQGFMFRKNVFLDYVFTN